MPSDIELIQRSGPIKSTNTTKPILFDPVKSTPFDLTARLHELAARKLDAIAADLDDMSSDPQACERRARALATVTLALDEITRAQSARTADGWIVDENDPRACPRDAEQLRTALAAALDRLNEKETISLT